MEATILGIGQVSACGAGVESLRRALEAPAPVPAPVDGSVTGLRALVADPGDWRSVIPARAARRLDAFSRGGLLAAALALGDAGLEIGDPARIGVAAATGHGNVSPMEFSISVHNAPVSAITSTLGIQGPCTTLTSFSHAWSGALTAAIVWLERRVADHVLVLASDEVHEFMGYAIRARGLEQVPGESYACLLLGRQGHGYGRVLAPLGQAGPPAPGSGGAVVAASSGPAGLVPHDRPAGASSYTHLWGQSPTSDAMATAAAALLLGDGRIESPVTVAVSGTGGMSSLIGLRS
jgi:hypothetical protein